VGVIGISNLVANNELLEAADSLKDIREIKEELNDHLVAINENTDEIEMNYSYLLDLTQRVQAMEKKLDAIFNAVSKLTIVEVEKPIQKISVDENEQQVFMFLYESHKAVDYAQICERLRKSEPFVRYCLNKLIEKGVTIKKHAINRKAYFILDEDFREMQAKHSIVSIKKTLTLDCFDQNVL